MPPAQEDVRSDVLELITHFSVRVRLPLLTIGVASAIGLFGLLGSLFLTGHLGSASGYNPFDLDAERTLPAAFSALLLVAGSLAAFALSRFGRPTRIHGVVPIAFGLFLLFMALDEGLAIHEKLETLTGIDWQVLYAPVMLVGGLAWLGLLWSMWRLVTGRVLLIGGAVAWAVSQVFELLQYGGFSSDGAAVRTWTVVPEELLEMVGSSLFALALLVVLRRVARNREAAPEHFLT